MVIVLCWAGAQCMHVTFSGSAGEKNPERCNNFEKNTSQLIGELDNLIIGIKYILCLFWDISIGQEHVSTTAAMSHYVCPKTFLLSINNKISISSSEYRWTVESNSDKSKSWFLGCNLACWCCLITLLPTSARQAQCCLFWERTRLCRGARQSRPTWRKVLKSYQIFAKNFISRNYEMMRFIL
jgi:hypothetical protein